MITPKDLKDESAFVRYLISLHNPTGRLHSSTPWVAHRDDFITAAGATIAHFRYAGDRDVALYFTNVHPAIIALLRSTAGAFEFIAQGSDATDGTAVFARTQAENLRTYAELFARLGKVEISE